VVELCRLALSYTGHAPADGSTHLLKGPTSSQPTGLSRANRLKHGPLGRLYSFFVLGLAPCFLVRGRFARKRLPVIIIMGRFQGGLPSCLRTGASHYSWTWTRLAFTSAGRWHGWMDILLLREWLCWCDHSGSSHGRESLVTGDSGGWLSSRSWSCIISR
jgi:hypothetical protein